MDILYTYNEKDICVRRNVNVAISSDMAEGLPIRTEGQVRVSLKRARPKETALSVRTYAQIMTGHEKEVVVHSTIMT